VILPQSMYPLDIRIAESRSAWVQAISRRQQIGSRLLRRTGGSGFVKTGDFEALADSQRDGFNSGARAGMRDVVSKRV
jgi:hypothetical protein